MALPTRRLLPLAADLLVLAWVAAWIVVAIAVAHEVGRLRDLSTTVVKAGIAVRSTGDALESLTSLPFVGGRIRPVATEVRAAGQSAVLSGRETRNSVNNLSTLLGLVSGLAPTLPLLAVYLPRRIGSIRAGRGAG
jgi:hypothetical protein